MYPHVGVGPLCLAINVSTSRGRALKGRGICVSISRGRAPIYNYWGQYSPRKRDVPFSIHLVCNFPRQTPVRGMQVGI